MIELDKGLENLLEDKVEFYPKLNNKKIHHVTVDFKDDKSCKRIEEKITCLVGVKNKKLWFAYDFSNKEVLNREETLKRFNINPKPSQY